ncbi:unnamed protein product [Brachionus calyciflorus]|uniref:Uncharacterized protein n=1 Tax=Brachionus calyciflorus TaxID=104777 RepID=A0A813M588_9BILA|nr:unnamed protein product [Brachionus calyciflorus]
MLMASKDRELYSLQFVRSGIIALIKYYENIILKINKQNEWSKTIVGVIKAGVPCPKLFSFYINDLISEIERLDAVVEMRQCRLILFFMLMTLPLRSTKIGLKKQLEVLC